MVRDLPGLEHCPCPAGSSLCPVLVCSRWRGPLPSSALLALWLVGLEELCPICLQQGGGARVETSLLTPPLSCCRYFINLCQRIYKGPLDCSERASVCKKSASGQVQVLGLVHTQRLDVIGEAPSPHLAWFQGLDWKTELS